jgi:hypothetical protein
MPISISPAVLMKLQNQHAMRISITASFKDRTAPSITQLIKDAIANAIFLKCIDSNFDSQHFATCRALPRAYPLIKQSGAYPGFTKFKNGWKKAKPSAYCGGTLNL